MKDPGVYVNNRSACSKASSGWSPAATPDPCVSPGPVVVPYPNTSKATDLKNGTTTIFIKNKMVSQKNKSYFSTSIGDEPATEGLSKGVVTAVIKGKSYFTSWSQNVKFEGLAVNRHQDLMTHNHGSFPGNTPTFPYIDKTATGSNPCEKEEEKMKKECEDKGVWPDKACEGLTEKHSYMDTKEAGAAQHNLDVPKKADAQDKKATSNSCIKSRKCNLVPFNKADDKDYCCGGQTGHHVIPGSFFGNCDNYKVNKDETGMSSEKIKKNRDKSKMHQEAPNVCAEGTTQYIGSHGRAHTALDEEIRTEIKSPIKGAPAYQTNMTIEKIIEVASRAHEKAFGCSRKCIEAQLSNYYLQDNKPCKTVDTKKLGKNTDTVKLSRSASTN